MQLKKLLEHFTEVKRYSVSGFGVKMSKVKVLTAMRRRFELYECLLVELTV